MEFGRRVSGEDQVSNRRTATILWGCVLCAVLVVASGAFDEAGAQWVATRYEVRTLQVFEDWHWVADPVQTEIMNLHRIIEGNRLAGNPAGNIGPLIRMTEINPHDYFAWEFLSYTYAVLGDSPSAANVDLRTVALFEFVPAAYPVVSRAAGRLNGWDPAGWRGRIMNIRCSGFLPVVPPQCYDRYMQAQQVYLNEVRCQAYTRIEETLTTYDTRMAFLQEWGN